MNGHGGLKGAPRLPDGSLMQSLLPAGVPGGHSGRSSGAARGLEKGVGFWQVNRRTHEVLLGVPKQNACAGNLPFPGQLGEESPQFRVRGEGASLADDIGEAREVEYRGLLAEQGTSALGLGWG